MNAAGLVNAAAFTHVPDYQLDSKPGQLTHRQLQQFYDEVTNLYTHADVYLFYPLTKRELACAFRGCQMVKVTGRKIAG